MLGCGVGEGIGIVIWGCCDSGASVPGGSVRDGSGGGGFRPADGNPGVGGGAGVALGPCCQCGGGHWAGDSACEGVRGGYAETGGP